MAEDNRKLSTASDWEYGLALWKLLQAAENWLYVTVSIALSLTKTPFVAEFVPRKNWDKMNFVQQQRFNPTGIHDCRSLCLFPLSNVWPKVMEKGWPWSQTARNIKREREREDLKQQAQEYSGHTILMFHILIIHAHYNWGHWTQHLTNISRETPSKRKKAASIPCSTASFKATVTSCQMYFPLQKG